MKSILCIIGISVFTILMLVAAIYEMKTETEEEKFKKIFLFNRGLY